MATSEMTGSSEPTSADAGGDLIDAIVQDRYGDTDVLRLERIAKPAIGDREVLVRVHAAGVDRSVWHLMSGLPYPVRLAGYGLRAPKTRVRGVDLAGRVEAIGSEVTTLQEGDEVFGIGEGTYAEYASAPEDKLTRKPENLSFDQAAVMPVSALAALQGLRDHGGVSPGQRVLIVGASGGVGSFGVQIAKAYGASVTGVCSGAKLDMVRSLGADDVIDYTREGLGARGVRYDLILDVGGNRRLSELRGALTPDGTLVIVGGETGGRWLGGTDRQLRAMMLSPFVRQKLGTFISSENSVDLATIRDLIEAGKLTPVIDRAYPLSEVPTAIRYLRDGRVRGKVVVTVRDTKDD